MGLLLIPFLSSVAKWTKRGQERGESKENQSRSSHSKIISCLHRLRMSTISVRLRARKNAQATLTQLGDSCINPQSAKPFSQWYHCPPFFMHKPKGGPTIPYHTFAVAHFICLLSVSLVAREECLAFFCFSICRPKRSHCPPNLQCYAPLHPSPTFVLSLSFFFLIFPDSVLCMH